MADTWTLPPALDAEIDDLLSLLPLVGVEPAVADRVFGPLVDRLAEAVLHDVRVRHEQGELPRERYLTELCQVVLALQQRDLLGDGFPRSR